MAFKGKPVLARPGALVRSETVHLWEKRQDVPTNRSLTCVLQAWSLRLLDQQVGRPDDSWRRAQSVPSSAGLWLEALLLGQTVRQVQL